jgi:mono/diheme cytochrome c family protein
METPPGNRGSLLASYQPFRSRIARMWPVLALALLAAAPDPGRALYLANCATCHLGQGGLIGQAGPPDLLRDPLPRGDGAEALATWIRQGTGSPAMPAFGEALSPEEIDALVRYIRAQRALTR